MFFKSNAPLTGGVKYIVAGLGNPDRKYENTRHNAGFIAVDIIADKCGVSLDRLKYKSYCATAELGGQKVLLMKPTTYMNNSGQSLVEAMNFYKIPPENCIIIFDDISLAGAKPEGWELADWVLSRFNDSERKLIEEAGEKAYNAAELIISGSIDKAMNLYNKIKSW